VVAVDMGFIRYVGRQSWRVVQQQQL